MNELEKRLFIIEGKIEYEGKDIMYIKPNPKMPLEDFAQLVQLYSDLGYKWWHPSDNGGYVLSKNKDKP